MRLAVIAFIGPVAGTFAAAVAIVRVCCVRTYIIIILNIERSAVGASKLDFSSLYNKTPNWSVVCVRNDIRFYVLLLYI